MKKVYTKPVMESEEFVSNEYVAACWTVTCTNSKSCGSFTGKGAYPEGLSETDGIGMYTGKINDKQGCIEVVESEGKPEWIDNICTVPSWQDPTRYLIEEAVYYIYKSLVGSGTVKAYHPVEVTEGYEKNGTFHPNASV